MKDRTGRQRRRRARAHWLLAFAAVGVAAVQDAWAQSFDKSWVVANSGTQPAAVDATLRAGGSTFIGGTFDYVGPDTGGAGITTVGVPPGTPTGLPHVDGTVHAIVVDPNGGWWIGGEFHEGGRRLRDEPRARRRERQRRHRLHAEPERPGAGARGQQHRGLRRRRLHDDRRIVADELREPLEQLQRDDV